jgi:hypothetical protein
MSGSQAALCQLATLAQASPQGLDERFLAIAPLDSALGGRLVVGVLTGDGQVVLSEDELLDLRDDGLIVYLDYAAPRGNFQLTEHGKAAAAQCR